MVYDVGMTSSILGGAARTLAFCLALAAPAAARAETVRVIVPDTSLQYLTFWVAEGAGLFRNEGIHIETFIPAAPQATPQAVTDGKAEVAVLPPPVYLELIDRKVPIPLIANLMRNDPINLVVRKSVLDARHVSLGAPLGQRLRALRGIKIGIASNPPPRLRALYAFAMTSRNSTVSTTTGDPGGLIPAGGAAARAWASVSNTTTDKPRPSTGSPQ